MSNEKQIVHLDDKIRLVTEARRKTIYHKTHVHTLNISMLEIPFFVLICIFIYFLGIKQFLLKR